MKIKAKRHKKKTDALGLSREKVFSPRLRVLDNEDISRLPFQISSTIEELAAIQLALQNLPFLHSPGEAVVLSDSRGELMQL